MQRTLATRRANVAGNGRGGRAKARPLQLARYSDVVPGLSLLGWADRYSEPLVVVRLVERIVGAAAAGAIFVDAAAGHRVERSVGRDCQSVRAGRHPTRRAFRSLSEDRYLTGISARDIHVSAVVDRQPWPLDVGEVDGQLRDLERLDVHLEDVVAALERRRTDEQVTGAIERHLIGLQCVTGEIHRNRPRDRRTTGGEDRDAIAGAIVRERLIDVDGSVGADRDLGRIPQAELERLERGALTGMELGDAG